MKKNKKDIRNGLKVEEKRSPAELVGAARGGSTAVTPSPFTDGATSTNQSIQTAPARQEKASQKNPLRSFANTGLPHPDVTSQARQETLEAGPIRRLATGGHSMNAVSHFDMESYLNELVGPLSGRRTWRRAKCPFHEPSRKHPLTLSVNVIHGGFRCHSARCGVHGSIYRLEELLEGKRTLTRRMPPVEILPARMQKKVAGATFPLPPDRAKELASKWANTLQTKPDLLREIERDYGVSAETLRQFEVGWGNPWGFYALTFPLVLDDGNMAFKIYRPKSRRSAEDAKSYFWPGLHGRSVPLFNTQSLMKSNGMPVILVGGEMKALSGAQRGLLTVGVISGEGASLKDHLEKFRGKRVVICMDNDDAGRKATEKYLNELAGVAKCVAAFPWDGLPYKALDDAFVANVEVAEVQRRLAKALDSFVWDDASNLILNPPPAPTPLVEDLLYPGNVAILAAPPKVGKTWLALEIALAVASGRLAVGALKTVQGRVAYLALEDSKSMVARRLAQLSSDTPKEGMLKILTEQSFKLTNPKHVEAIIQETMGFNLLVIDPLRRAHTEDEDKSHNVALIIDALRRIARETGATILAVHHVTKGWDPDSDVFARIRGSGDLLAGPDTAIVLDRKREEDWVGVWAVHKEDESPAPFCFMRVHDDAGTVHWKVKREPLEIVRAEERKADIESRIREFVNANPGANSEAIKEACRGMRRQDILKVRDEMQESGEIIVIERGRTKLHYPKGIVPVPADE